MLAAQSKLINTGYEFCPKCGQKLIKKGYTQSQFHAVFTDHKVGIQKHKCCNPECDWQSTPTTTAVFGTSIHPDLAKLQAEQGALYSYREVQSNLEKLTVHRRPVNNHKKIKLMTTAVGAVLAEENLTPPGSENCAPPAPEVIVQVDGGHIPIKDKDKRSFEALSAFVYRPESIRTIDTLTGQKGWFLCPTDAAWDEYESLRQTALKASLALHQFLLPLGTYEQVREDAAVRALRASSTVVESVEAPNAELVDVGEGLSDADTENVHSTVNFLQSALTETWSEAVNENAVTATVVLAPDLDCEQPEEDEPVASPHTPLSISTEPSSAPVLVDPNTMLLALPVLASTPVWIDPNLVQLDLGTQPRAGGMLDKLLKRYAKEMKTELWHWQSDIPTVLFDGRRYFPNGAGHHRLGAAALAEKQILVYLKQGTIADAKLEAAKGEQQHSEGRTNKDKRNQVRMVLTDPEVLERLETLFGHPGSFPSDRAIADYCRVTPPTVASVIAGLVEEGLLSLPEERVGKDRRIQKTKKIGKQAADGGDGDGEAAPERSERQRFSKLYKEFGGARALAIELLPDLSASDLNALAEAIQARLADDAE